MGSLLSRRAVWLIALPVVLFATAMFATASIERNSATHAGRQQEASQRLLTAMLDQETGARGYFQTGKPVFLEPWYRGSSDFVAGLAESRALAGSDATLQRSLAAQERIGLEWHGATQAEIDSFAVSGTRPSLPAALERKDALDAFRAANASFTMLLTQRGDHQLALATWLAVLVAAGLSVALAAGGLLLVRRLSHEETVRLRRQAELRDLLQASDTEEESASLLIRHIERLIPGSGAAVMNRNNSDDRLEPLLSARSEETALKDLASAQLRPRSCLAVRLSRPHNHEPGNDELVKCEVCGKIDANVACEPLLVGGHVIGAVLVTQAKQITSQQRAGVRDSVLQAAPILANQRNLALAERRAASDSLTGLPNRRAADENLKRMAAHAGRAGMPLAAILLDLDHFKEINDVHGHDQGDEVLAAVSQTISATLRASDFAARYGGEEFLVLLPDTDRQGAQTLAEKLRVAIAQSDLPRSGIVTASLGIAIFPQDASETDLLLRQADRALYQAKERGRNRVETVEQAGPFPDGTEPESRDSQHSYPEVVELTASGNGGPPPASTLSV